MTVSNYEPEDLRNNKLHDTDRAFHDWYRFVLSFPPHLVRAYFEQFELDEDSIVLDPFCGTGTTLVEAKKRSIRSYGIEASPMGFFASRVKTDWDIDIENLLSSSREVVKKAKKAYLSSNELLEFTPEQKQITLTNSISPVPLHKCLLLLRETEKVEEPKVRNLLQLALAHVAVFSASNLKFGPEVGVRSKKKEDAGVFEDFEQKVEQIAKDLVEFKSQARIPATVLLSDARNLNGSFPEGIFDAVITSPPYPNEKDYTRTTRLESVLLGFMKNRKDLRSYKENLLRSNTRNVYITDREDRLILPGSKIDRIAQEIERRRIALRKTSGFEKLYPRVTRLYFGGMKQHLLSLQRYLRPGAKLAYVVGDQASYLQVMIRTGELLAEIAEEIGYRVRELELFRTRISTATGDQLREEVLLLEWNPQRRLKTMKKETAQQTRYGQLIERVFFKNYKRGAKEVSFVREEFELIAKELDIRLPKNLGDIIYSYRYRNNLPQSILQLLNPGEEWVIRSAGRGRYLFARTTIHRIVPNPRLSKIKILDSTPEIIRRYALNDEQALLAILRYNRLIDIFLGLTCYPLQSHLRTTVPAMGQVETDEIYIGVSKNGNQYVIPVQAKGKNEELGIIQIEQDFAISRNKFPDLICRSVAAQFMANDLIAMFEFEQGPDGITIKEEKHYLIVPNEELNRCEINKDQEESV